MRFYRSLYSKNILQLKNILFNMHFYFSNPIRIERSTRKFFTRILEFLFSKVNQIRIIDFTIRTYSNQTDLVNLNLFSRKSKSNFYY